jgi:hypothetical protein
VNFRRLGDFFLWAFFENCRSSQKMLGYSFLRKTLCISFVEKWLWVHFGRFLPKRIWSLWLATASRSQLDRKPITAITELKKGGKFKMI